MIARPAACFSLLLCSTIGLPACDRNLLVPGLSDLGPVFKDPRPCGPGVVQVPDEGRVHVPDCQRVSYNANPPASGSHWPQRGEWGVFLDRVVPRERWVHNLEHGGIVLLYNCPGVASLPPSECSDGGLPDPDGGAGGDGGVSSGCPDITSALVQLMNERPLDQFGVKRVVVTGDPLLPTTVAAVAWDWAWTGTSVDLPALRCFRDLRYDLGPESLP